MKDSSQVWTGILPHFWLEIKPFFISELVIQSCMNAVLGMDAQYYLLSLKDVAVGGQPAPSRSTKITLKNKVLWFSVSN